MAEMEASKGSEHKETAQEFLAEMGRKLSDSLLIPALSIGLKTGMIDALQSYTEPKTSREIAEKAGLKERYVREWLGVMATGGFVDLVPGEPDNRFFFPMHRREILPKLAPWIHLVPTFLNVHEELMTCFPKDGPLGVRHESFVGFHDHRVGCMQTDFSVETMMTTIGKVPGLLSALESGITICDMGCGSGTIAIQFAERFPKSQIYGLDISKSAIESTKQTARDKGLNNCHFKVEDVCNISPEFDEKFEYVYMFDVLHDLPHVAKGLQCMKKTMKKGSYLTIIDLGLHTKVEDNMSNTFASFVYGCGLYYCVPASLHIGGMEHGGYGAAWGWEKAIECIGEAGFQDPKVVQWDIGVQVHMLSQKPTK